MIISGEVVDAPVVARHMRAAYSSMPKFESFHGGTLLVARNMFDRQLMADLAEEAKLIMAAGLNWHETTSDKSPTSVESCGGIVYDPYTDAALARVALGTLGTKAPRCNYLINRQQPGAAQEWHTDTQAGGVWVVQASDGGAFDFVEAGVNLRPYDVPDDEIGGFYTTYDPEFVNTIEVNAGDAVVQTQPNIIHRGRNLSDQVRFNAGIYNR